MRVVDPKPDLLFRQFAPLRLVARRLKSSAVPAAACFDPDDFMLMSWCHPDRPATISLFKHVGTRRYLNLDADGNAYRYVTPAAGNPNRAGTYVPHKSWRETLDDLGLGDQDGIGDGPGMASER